MKDTAKNTVIVLRGQREVNITEAKGERVLRKKDGVSSATRT